MEKLSYSKLNKKLLAGEKVSNPIVGYRKYGEDRIPQTLYPMKFISPYLEGKSGKRLCYDFETEEIYLK